MAEAAVEERPPARFYCHMCNLQFQHASSNFTCPHCSDGFIEELQDNHADYQEEEWPEVEEMDQSVGASVPGPDRGGRPGRVRSNSLGPSRYARMGRPRTLTRLASSNLRHNVPFDNLIQEFIINLGVGVNWGAGGNMQVFLGNPGDYAWGREGLDAIMTQLLNQMDNAGPPPVSKDVIDALQVVEITDEEVSQKRQCSVCWEDFVLREQVRQLPCSHIYHENCIRPWLELHGTCPICRQNLTAGGQEGEAQEGGGGVGGGGGGQAPTDTNGITNQARNVQNLLIELFGSSPSTPSMSPTPSSSGQNNWNDTI